ncbi:MAG TPA: response regulator transcription factor [Candidatus Acidoferrum sp.]|nr:response regulator transcription factor [Candidatus Acidoferrum sp.]
MRRRNEHFRIVIADDHELVRRGIRSLLTAHHDWQVVGEAGDGIEAARLAIRLRPRVLIMDITMPKLDGLEATRRILKESPDLKILILTMHESDQMVRRILEAGARGYVLKSDLAEQLIQAVREVSQGRLFLTPKVSDMVLRGFLEAAKRPPSAESDEARPTAREQEILRLLVTGKSNKEIGGLLGIAVRTVETHRAKIMLKLGVHSVAELIHYAMDKGLVTFRASAP